MAALDDLTTLVGFPTVSDRPNGDLVGWLADRLDGLGFRVRIVHDANQPGKSGIEASAGPAGTDGLMLTGHLDVVPTEHQPWTSDPFVLTRRGDRLYGRGTADMKGFIAATLEAARALPIRGLRKELMLAWTWDEEVGCHGSAEMVRGWKRAERPVPSSCLVGEPTGFRVFRMHAGHTSVRVVIRGRAAHSSHPESGINAIEGAAEVVSAIRRWAAALREQPREIPEMSQPWTKVNIGQISGGSAVNIVPDHVELRVGFRPLPGESEDALLNGLRQVVRGVGGPWSIQAEREHGIRALHTRKGTELEALLLEFASSREVGAAPFATDGGNLVDAGTSPLVFGPGSIEVAHQADEYISEADLFRASTVLQGVIEARCGSSHAG